MRRAPPSPETHGSELGRESWTDKPCARTVTGWAVVITMEHPPVIRLQENPSTTMAPVYSSNTTRPQDFVNT
ncbi:hypothetical protein DPSP01_005348 [Paraphaeosphaeria sporulosa]